MMIAEQVNGQAPDSGSLWTPGAALFWGQGVLPWPESVAARSPTSPKSIPGDNSPSHSQTDDGAKGISRQLSVSKHYAGRIYASTN